MHIKTIKVSDKGQIAIPKDIRERAGIKRGDELILYERDGQILLESIGNLLDWKEKDFKTFERLSEESLKRIWDNPEDERWSQELLARARRAGAVPVQRPRRGKSQASSRRLK